MITSCAKKTEITTFAKVAHYILRNPERASLVTEWQSYPYSGAMVSGYPSLDPRQENYWEKFWKIHGRLTSWRKT